ncbi:MAG: MFS transporter [Bdellovibrionaceae bacterium]|nr:MFS transporter [Pseudobdellovibrionaceae bacterium]MBX3034511.1 MFS transporter [Pseudobdellovibrionaceae bacterium]
MNNSIVREIFSKKMLVLFVLGFSSGLPFLLTGGTLKLWLARENVDLSTIGHFGWVGMSYSLKFLWAPLLDRFNLLGLGRRRSWMMLSQLMLVLGLVFLGFLSPQQNLSLIAFVCIGVAFFSATQDIAIDAYRRELLEDSELGLGTTMGMYGYRIAMLVSGGIGVSLVGVEGWNLTWGQLYWLMAALMGLGFLTALLAPEPDVNPDHQPKTLMAAVVGPFQEFLRRDGALVVLLFVFLFKLGDALGGAMLNPFYVQMGYSNVDIGFIAKTVGLSSSLLGLLLGGIIIIKLGIYRSLWIFGVLQALSTAGFALITFTGPEKWALACTVVFEDISAGMGNAAFVAFIASICNRRYTATQFAILSSIATLGRNFFSGFSGDMVKVLDWANFFFVCGLIALPGLLMLFLMRRYQSEPLSEQ